MHVLWRGAMLALLLTAAADRDVRASTQAAGLKIVIIAGEDAVNIIQQKTAVAPIVEVRDRNDQPVAGAIVQFAIEGGRATFGGARTLTVTTNLAGRATVAGMTPTASGAVKISASAAFQGQTAMVAIAQTNVMTAAEAAAAASAGGAGGISGGAAAGSGGGAGGGSGGAAAGAGGVAGGGGGGISGAMIGGIAVAAAGGAAVAAKAAAGGGSDPAEPIAAPVPTPAPTPAPPPPAPITYAGAFSGQLVITTTVVSSALTTTCVSTNAMNGTLMMTLTRSADGSVTGTAQTTGTQVEIGFTASPFCQAAPGPAPLNNFYQASGTSGSVAFSGQTGSTAPTPAPSVGSVTCSDSRAFSGALADGAVSGTLTFGRTCDGTSNVNGVSSVITGRGTTTVPVTLR